MHDPMVVLFDVKIPLPHWRWKTMGYEPRWGVRAYRRTNPENLGEFVYSPLRPASWKVYIAGRRIRWTDLLTIWHIEPNGRDYGAVCGRLPHGWRRLVFMFRHIAHLSIQVRPWQQFNRWAFQRCAHCGGRSRRSMSVNVGGGWGGEPQRAFRSAPGLYHMACSDLVHAQRQRDEAWKALHDLGVTKEALIAVGWGWNEAFRVVYDTEQAQQRREARRG